jgi:DNA-binding NtrC family response regulator
MTEVAQGRFREDLFYRVHVIPIQMPPLRERDQDIVTLANHFIKIYARQDHKKFIGLNKETERLFEQYSWPGNVRQLQNIIRNIIILNNDKYVTVEHLPPLLTAKPTTLQPQSVGKPIPPLESPHQSLPVQETTISVVPSNAAAEDETSPVARASIKPVSIKPMWQVERETIQQAIEYCDGNVLNAAVLLELSPSTVYRKKQAWESEDDFEQA